MKKLSLSDLRHHAIAHSLFRPVSLGAAMRKLGFVQADPIRAPARAQDLILRHRAIDYHAGDLEAKYRKLKLEEDYLYAYGFMPLATWQLMHPRTQRRLNALESKVLALVQNERHMHPRDLETHLGKARVVNAWGGYSKSTTRTLERLHYLGLVRVAGRDNGIRLYQAVPRPSVELDAKERLKQLVLLIASIQAPLPAASLQSTLRHLGYSAPHLAGRLGAVATLVKSGDLTETEVQGVRYVWPTARVSRKEPDMQVRFLAPFDPVVWDRKRFELFWGWRYRFEAYTPPAKRVLGYYAMPLLYGADVIGWVNITRQAQRVDILPGFVKTRPREPQFKAAFDAEVERFKTFLLAGK